MSRQIPGDITVYTVGGIALLDYIHDTVYRASVETVEGRSIAYFGRSARAVKKGGEFRSKIMSDSGSTCQNRITNLDVSALSIDGTAYATMLRGGSFTGDFTIVEASAVGDLWKFPYIVAKDYSAEVDLMLPLSATANASRLVGADIHSSNTEDLCMTFSITIDGVAYALPMMVVGIEHQFNDNDLAMYKVSLKGKGPDSDVTAYPTTPTGTTSLLEKAFNDPQTALAYTFTPYSTAAKGISLTGNLLIAGFSFTFNDKQIIDIDYTFHTQGAVTETLL